MATQLQLVKLKNDVPRLHRHSFPNDFVFGTASSAYQYEGAAEKRGKNMWDTFCHKTPWKIKDRSNGDVAIDHHNRFKEDVRIMKEMGVDAYRFSISWSRILPTGKLIGGVNEAGVNFYKELIKELTDNGIEPYPTLFHFDTPQPLQDEYGGFLSPKIVNDFRDFAEVCFSRFGNKVKHWITLNEPWSYCYGGYVTGDIAPGSRSIPKPHHHHHHHHHQLFGVGAGTAGTAGAGTVGDKGGAFSMDGGGTTWQHLRFSGGDPTPDQPLDLPAVGMGGGGTQLHLHFNDQWDSTPDDLEEDDMVLPHGKDGQFQVQGGQFQVQCGQFRPKRGSKPYWVAHHMLLAHAAAVQKYRQRYQFIRGEKNGMIGITLVSMWFEPYSESKCDRDAATRAQDFFFGWFMDPLTKGDYPQSMKTNVGSRLPKFTAEEARMVKGSFDFLGLNYYTANYAANLTKPHHGRPNYIADTQVDLRTHRDRKPIGPQAGSNWLFVYPEGIWKLLLYIKNVYNNPLIYITENGYVEVNDPSKPVGEACLDYKRVDYYYRHLYYVQRAINDHVNVKGYFAWSLLDNFEWDSGYTVRFGIHLVDYKDNLKRYKKLSALWFTAFLQDRGK